MQLADVVMAAARRIAGQGGTVTLSQVQADPEVARLVRSPERVTDIMGELAGYGLVRMTARHPVPAWRVITEEE